MKYARGFFRLLSITLAGAVILLQFSLYSRMERIESEVLDIGTRGELRSKRISLLQKNIAALSSWFLDGENKLISRIDSLKETAVEKLSLNSAEVRSLTRTMISIDKRMEKNTGHNKSIQAEDDPAFTELLAEGESFYKTGRYADSISVYKKILSIEPSNIDAVVRYNASVFYLNPGDESNFPEIRNALNPLLTDTDCSRDLRRIIGAVFKGMKLEEGQI